MAKHRFRASYWQYRTFVAQYRPSLTLRVQPLITAMHMIRYGIQTRTAMIMYATNTLSNLGSLVTFPEYWFDRWNNLTELRSDSF